MSQQNFNELGKLFDKAKKNYLSNKNIGQFLGIKSNKHSDLDGASVCLLIKDQIVLSQLLCALDGLVKTILLLPSSLHSKELAELTNSVSPSFFITDQEANSTINSHHPSELLEASNTQSFQSRHDTAWLICTSGTTSKPKIVSHSVQTLCASTKLNLNKDYIWGQLYRLERFAGLQVFLQALLNENKIFFRDDEKPLSEVLKFFSEMKVNSISGTPTIWRSILQTKEGLSLALENITLGGEIADQQILNALKYSFPNARIRHIYASTEAGVGFSISDGNPGFPLSFLSNPPDGVELRINQENSTLEIKRRGVKTCYFNAQDPYLTDDGFVLTGDLVKITGERVLFMGRENGSINIGGNKVYPEQVENVLNLYPGVQFASVYPKRNSFSGNLVACKIVVDHTVGKTQIDLSKLKSDLIKHCRQHLSYYQTPTIIDFIDEIPVTETGKIERTPNERQ